MESNIIYSSYRVITMVATSGSGKTLQSFDLAAKHVVIYCVCHPNFTVSLEIHDRNLIRLAQDAHTLYNP